MLPTSNSRRSFLRRWARNLSTTLGEDSGWRLAGKLFALMWGLAGLWLTWQTFQTNLRLEQLRHAEESYSSLLADLGSGSGRLRADALGRVPGLLTQRVYPRAIVSPWESLKLLLGVGTEGQPAFLDPIRRQLHEYVHSEAKGSEQLVAGESKAFVNTLTSLGPEGWFFGEAKPSGSSRKNLTWLWTTPPEGAQAEAVSLARSLFRGAQLRQVEFPGFELTGADFTGAILARPLFVKAILNDSSFREARLLGADLSNAQLRRAQMQKVHFEFSTLYGCEMQSANLGGASFENTFISRVILAPLPGGAATDLSRVEFINCTISDIDAQGAKLFGIRITQTDVKATSSLGATHSDFSGADLRSSHLDNVNFSDSRFVKAHLDAASARSAHFNFSDLRGAILDKADLTGADLSDAQGLRLVDLRNGRGIGSCANTNLAHVKGITREQLAEMIKRGAVVIESEDRWKAFKQQGFPATRWKEFAQPMAEAQ